MLNVSVVFVPTGSRANGVNSLWWIDHDRMTEFLERLTWPIQAQIQSASGILTEWDEVNRRQRIWVSPIEPVQHLI